MAPEAPLAALAHPPDAASIASPTAVVVDDVAVDILNKLNKINSIFKTYFDLLTVSFSDAAALIHSFAAALIYF